MVSSDPEKVAETVKVVSSTWAGVDLRWGSGAHARGDIKVMPHGLNMTFEAQAESRSRVGDGPTMLRPLPKASTVLTTGEDWFWVENPARFNGLNISLDPGLMKAYAFRNGWEMPRLRSVAFDSDMRLHDIAKLIIDELEHGSGGQLYQDALINLTMTHLAKTYGLQSTKQERSRLDESRLLAVRDYIEDRIGDMLPLDALAEVAGMSTFHFARAFKRKTGQPPHQYVVARRMERARRLLVDSDLSLAEVAFRVGYTSLSHFIRQFRAALDLTPGEVRRRRA